MPHRKGQQELEREILELTDRLIENTIEIGMLTGEEFEHKQTEGVNIVVKLATVLEEYLGGSPEHFEQVIQELTKQKLPDENVLKSFGDFRFHLEEAIQKGLKLYHDNQHSVINEESVEITCCSQKEPENGVDIDSNLDPVADSTNDPAYEEARADEDNISLEEKDRILKEDTISNPQEDNLHCFSSEIVDTSIPEQPAFGTEHSLEKDYISSPKEEESEKLSVETINEDIDTDTLNTQHDNWHTALKLVFPDATIIKNHTMKGLAFSYYIPEYSIAIDLNPSDKKEAVWKEYYCRQEKIKLLSVAIQEDTHIRRIVRNLRRALAQNISQNIS